VAGAIAGNVLVTGGAGFIGSYLTEHLLRKGHRVTVLDNFSNGRVENIQHLLDNPMLTLVKEDLKKPTRLRRTARDCDLVFHLAANPDVRSGESHPGTHFRENILTTFNLLEALRKNGRPKVLVFTSTSTVYGEAAQIPTQEDYGPLTPISTYGASKLACEALISGYAHTFNHRALILRLANITGPRSNHGVIVDFVQKIRANPRELTVLGDGNQQKSYLHVSDCVKAITHLTDGFLKSAERVDFYNVGSSDTITVVEIARTVAEQMNASGLRYRFTGGVNGGRGWKGDVKVMQLSIRKTAATGWTPRYTSRQAVTLTARALARENPAQKRGTPTATRQRPTRPGKARS